MIRLSKFRLHAFPIFRLAHLTTVGFEVVHIGKVFDVTITPTDKVPDKIKTRPKKKKRGVNSELVDVTVCPLCDEIMVSGLCLNKTCTNSRVN